MTRYCPGCIPECESSLKWLDSHFPLSQGLPPGMKPLRECFLFAKCYSDVIIYFSQQIGEIGGLSRVDCTSGRKARTKRPADSEVVLLTVSGCHHLHRHRHCHHHHHVCSWQVAEKHKAWLLPTRNLKKSRYVNPEVYIYPFSHIFI